MNITQHLDLLEIAVGPRMKIGPVDVRCEGVVSLQWEAWIPVLRVEQMSRSDPVQGTNRATQIHMVAGHQEPPTASAKLGNRLALLWPQTRSRIDGKQPHFVEVAAMERCENRIGRFKRF